MAYTPVTLAVPKGGTGQVTLTSHGVLVGEGTSAINQVAAGTAGQVLQSGGALADPVYSTATFPATAGTTGTLLRSNGTNWINTFATYPTTIAANQMLYASSNNAINPLVSANSGVLTTDASGVPSIDTTNFVRQTTGMQMKGNNTNTAPPAGFIGENIRSFNSSGQASPGTTQSFNITSISLTAGIWDVSGIGLGSFSGLSTQWGVTLSATSATSAVTGGDNATSAVYTSGSGFQVTGSVPSFRVTLSGTTTYYLVGVGSFSTGSCTGFGRISGTRVG